MDKITATFPTLDKWGDDVGRPFIPPEGSEMAIDDEDWPPERLSQVAFMGLGSARDHLHAVRVLIEARQLFPFAQSTLIRAALVGGAQAVWVLAPAERGTRTARARTVALHMDNEHRKHLEQLRALSEVPHEGTELVYERVVQRLQELEARRTADGQRSSLNTTEMVEQAAASAFGTAALTQEVVSIWRLTSGTTHGFAWALLGQAGTGQLAAADDDGIAAFGAAGDIQRIANNYLAAFHLAAHGWKLLAERSGT